MTVGELIAKLQDAPVDARIMLNDEPLADVEIAAGMGREPIVLLWDVSHCEGT